jgi:hypothetical protein
MNKEDKSCTTCRHCYTEESFDDVFPACELLYANRIDDPDHECCEDYNICGVDDISGHCINCLTCKEDI